jgi:hypothetical protein
MANGESSVFWYNEGHADDSEDKKSRRAKNVKKVVNELPDEYKDNVPGWLEAGGEPDKWIEGEGPGASDGLNIGANFYESYLKAADEKFSINNLLAKCSTDQRNVIETNNSVDLDTYGGGEFPVGYGLNTDVLCSSDSTFDQLQEQINYAEEVLAGELLLEKFGKEIADGSNWDTSSFTNAFLDAFNLTGLSATEQDFMQGLIGSIDENLYGRGRQVSFKEQCFFLSNILQFTAARKMFDVTADTDQTYRKELIDIAGNGNIAAANRCISVNGEPFSFINKLTQSPTKQFLFNMKNDEISSLQPLIRLFKIISDEDGKETAVEFKFDTHYTKNDIDSLLTTAEHRGHGVGIKSFNFAYEANNPFAIKKSISAKLVLHAANFGELLRDRGTDPTYKYADLALKTGALTRVTSNPQASDVVIENAEKLNFRLRAIVGWARPNGFGTLLSQESLTAVYNSCVTLNLTPTIHNFDIDETGRVTFTLNYLAYIEDYFDQPNFDIFSNAETIAEQAKRNAKIVAAEKKCKAKEVTKQTSDEEKQKIEVEKKDNLRSLMRTMIARKKLRTIEIPINELNQYRVGGPTALIDLDTIFNYMSRLVTLDEADNNDKELDDILEEPQEGIPGYQNATKSDVTSVLTKGRLNPNETVTFFWISDLVDVILSNIGKTLDELPVALEEAKQGLSADEKQQINEEIINVKRRAENFKKLRIVLGPVELVNANVSPGEDPQFLQANMGDIPISAKYFMEWLTNKMLKVNRQTYPLPVFLNDLFNQFVRDFLNNDPCYGNTIKQKVRVAQTAVTAYKSISTDTEAARKARDGVAVGDTDYQEDLETLLEEQIADKGYGYTLDLTEIQDSPVLKVMGPLDDVRDSGDFIDEYNYMIYHAARVQPMELLQADRAQDTNRGVFHYGIGRDRGIIKNINLQKTDSPGLAEVRYEQEGYDGLKQLRVVYDASIKTYLDVTCYPGTYIYVEPRSFDPTLEPEEYTSLGIGGYYMVTRTDHTMGPGIAETSITAKWVAQVHANTVYTNLPDCEDINRKRRETLTNEGFKSFYGDFANLLDFEEAVEALEKRKLEALGYPP